MSDHDVMAVEAKVHVVKVGRKDLTKAKFQQLDTIECRYSRPADSDGPWTAMDDRWPKAKPVARVRIPGKHYSQLWLLVAYEGVLYRSQYGEGHDEQDWLDSYGDLPLVLL